MLIISYYCQSNSIITKDYYQPSLVNQVINKIQQPTIGGPIYHMALEFAREAFAVRRQRQHLQCLRKLWRLSLGWFGGRWFIGFPVAIPKWHMEYDLMHLRNASFNLLIHVCFIFFSCFSDPTILLRGVVIMETNAPKVHLRSSCLTFVDRQPQLLLDLKRKIN